jgi:thioredoxin 1
MLDDIKKGFSLVKFGATWCNPCKLVEKTLHNVEAEFANVRFMKVDVDDNPDLAKDYKIRSVPTVILFRDGEETARIVGVVKIEALRKAIKDLVKDQAA